MSGAGHLILAWDGEDAGADARRVAARPAHLAVISRWAAAGRLTLGVPLFREGGGVAGSMMVLGGEDELGVRAYIAEEPFARQGVWRRHEAIPARVAALPYQALPSTGEVPRERTHVVTLAWDGSDAGAVARRLAAREAHLARLLPFAQDGTLTLGGAMLDAGGAMRGSFAVTRHADLGAAERFWAEDPYAREGVWQRVERWATRLAPLPYRAIAP